jgi:GNAT superfamily N-acetyltransferase
MRWLCVTRVLVKHGADGLLSRFLAPMWVLPAHQGRGVASLLLRDAIELADSDDQAPPMYLEAFSDARPIYERFGFQGVEGEEAVMVRKPPKSVKVQA